MSEREREELETARRTMLTVYDGMTEREQMAWDLGEAFRSIFNALNLMDEEDEKEVNGDEQNIQAGNQQQNSRNQEI